MPFTPYSPQKSGSAPGGGGFTPYGKLDEKTAAPALSASGTILSHLSKFVSDTGEEASGAFNQGKEDLQTNANVQGSGAGAGTKIKSEVETGMHVAADAANGIFAPLTAGIKDLSDAASDNEHVQNFTKHPLVSGILDKNSEMNKKMSAWATAHPEAARALSDTITVAGAVAGGEGGAGVAGKVAKVGGDLTKGATEVGGDLASRVNSTVKAQRSASALDKIKDIVAPRLDAKEGEAAVSEGRVGDPKGPLRTQKVAPSARTTKVAEAAQEYVKPGRTFSQNATSIKNGIVKEATALKTKIADADHPYTFKELEAKLKDVPMPELIKTGDAATQRLGRRVVSKFMELARKGKGNVSELLDARKDFDGWVESEFGDLHGTEKNSAIKSLVKGVRNAANDFIGENLPDGFGYQESLDKQSLLYDALDNVSEKAARGAPTKQGEVGSNILDRHPKTTDAVKKGAVGAIGILGGAEAIKHL